MHAWYIGLFNITAICMINLALVIRSLMNMISYVNEYALVLGKARDGLAVTVLLIVLHPRAWPVAGDLLLRFVSFMNTVSFL